MANKKTTTKTTRVARAGTVITGLKKRFPNGGQTLTLAGGGIVITVTEAIAELQSLIDNRANVTTTRAAAKAAVDAENAKMPALIALLNAIVAYIKANFGADATALADFGLEPNKARTPMTAEAKAVAAAKRQATREARGEIGAEKKKALKGNVTATLVVTPAAPAPTTTPEPTAALAAPPKA
jgi:hypothetical protein